MPFHHLPKRLTVFLIRRVSVKSGGCVRVVGGRINFLTQ